jgi:hypothetical protein
MLTYNVEFRRLEDVSLLDAYGETGVYVLWSSRASVRPSYIGEGYILDRFLSHTKKSWATKPLNGVMTILDGANPRELKWRAEVIEYALLWVAEEIDRFPPNNTSLGKMSGLHKLVSRADHDVGVIRINVRGVDPLLPPHRGTMPSSKSIRIDMKEFEIEHGWRARS